MLKCDFHLHCNDFRDGVFYSEHQLIDRMAGLGYDVIAITNHWHRTYDADLAKYAESKGILLIPGAELRIRRRDVLVLNITDDEVDAIKSLKDLAKIKDENHLIAAPHPYFILGSCLGRKLERHIELFDAVEYCHFYWGPVNLNRRAVRVAEEHNLPMIGTSDAHHFFQIGHTYTMVDSDKDIMSVINAVKAGRTKLVTKPLKLWQFSVIFLIVAKSYVFKALHHSKRFIKHISAYIMPWKSTSGKLR